MITTSKRGMTMNSKFKYKEYSNLLVWPTGLKALEVYILMINSIVNSNNSQMKHKMMFMLYKENRQGQHLLLLQPKILTIRE